jgi:sulfopyruvate decarboxylase subunit alpha|tara:strand:+ start:134 stop:676 length:543 start_codon:yes stop_codon:yes gene_type:complete
MKDKTNGPPPVIEVLEHRPSQLLVTLRDQEFRTAVTVPDSWLGQLLVEIENEATMQLIRATHEEEALAIACGARVGGTRTALFIQNVGILTMGAGLVSLAMRYQIPLLILASFRGTIHDSTFFHIPKGRVTLPVLRAMGLHHAVVRPDAPISQQVEQAAAFAEEASLPFVLLMGREDVQW